MRSLDEAGNELNLRPLPEQAALLLDSLNAPPRLVAHLLLVHDVAAQLVASVLTRWPNVPLDSEAVLLGAAWHDIGKIKYPEELSYSGHRHEEAGLTLLLDSGIKLRLARFAQTHGTWSSEPSIALEDLLVALADTCWKGKRNKVLEQRIIDCLAEYQPIQRWEILLELDNAIEKLAADGDLRLAWQATFPVANGTP